MIINVLQTQIFPESFAWYCKILMNELSQKWELLLCQSWYLLEKDLTFRCCKYESIMDIVIKYIHEIWYLKLSNSVVFAKTFQSYLIKNQNDNSKKKILNPCFTKFTNQDFKPSTNNQVMPKYYIKRRFWHFK